jgi:hypothetical protein
MYRRSAATTSPYRFLSSWAFSRCACKGKQASPLMQKRYHKKDMWGIAGRVVLLAF